VIDTHCHILPYLDDGPKNLQEALNMARQAVSDGISGVIATPHTHNASYVNSREKVLASTKLLQKQLNLQRIPLKIYPGAEIHIHFDLLDNIRQKKVATLADSHKYLLLELPRFTIPLYTDELLEGLLLNGYLPIIAHPERNVVIQSEPEILDNWLNLGVTTQLTAGSLLGKWGKKIQRLSKLMVKRNQVYLLGSDGHNLNKRKIELKAAYQEIGEINSNSALQIKRNAYSILASRHPN